MEKNNDKGIDSKVRATVIKKTTKTKLLGNKRTNQDRHLVGKGVKKNNEKKSKKGSGNNLGTYKNLKDLWT